ncbi:uncharacterized protein LOC128449543 isoform X2 [Pleuronectes platessa]|uniref:uncharacterized protein LOC128449543 isoform X2 n=1 Tax=Pleuronectes platessa TaxID=8262 RepID=UPI00232A1D4C|nr:uncharacterized protein LOC128449543 isoform X2 [Pleuronectes platessa]
MIPDLQCGNNIVCFKPGSDDICSIMTFTFTSCTNTSIQLNRHITRDFLDVKNINQTAPTQFPVEFETKLPPNCNLSIDYTCHIFYPRRDYYPWFDRFNEANDRGPTHRWIDRFNETKNLSELEPFMDYECIGLIKDTNNVNVYDTTEVKVRIDCDLKIDFTNTSTTNTSSQLTWTTTSNRCKDVIQNLPKLSFHCSCVDSAQRVKCVTGSKKPSGGTCYITDLQPDTDYTCWVQPDYNDWESENSSSVKLKTKIGDNDKAGIVFHVFHILLTSGALLLVVYKIYDLKLGKSHCCWMEKPGDKGQESLKLSALEKEVQELRKLLVETQTSLEASRQPQRAESRPALMLPVQGHGAVPGLMEQHEQSKLRKEKTEAQSRAREGDCEPCKDSRWPGCP